MYMPLSPHQVDSFTPEGSLAAAAAKLKHVASCGFTAVQLMPLAEHSDAWGYNPRQLMSLHGSFGSPNVRGCRDEGALGT